MSTKKAFLPIVELLEANKNKMVSAVLDQVMEITAAKAGGGGRSSSNVHKNDKGEVTHIFCYYHKKWEAVETAEYGKKASSPTGYNNMCKEGVAAWTKQQRDAKKAKDDLLSQVGTGDVKPGDIQTRMDEIEKARGKVIPREDKHGTTDEPGGKSNKAA